MKDSLIGRAQAGDEAAWRELYRTHRLEVVRVVQRTLGPSPDVEDVVQDVFVHLFRSIGSFRGESKFSTWLFRLSWNVARMHIRKLQARPRLVAEESEERFAGERAHAEGRPDEAAERNRRLAALHALLRTLSPKKAEVLLLHDFHGKTPAEIGELVGAPVLTVRTRLFYARKELYGAMLKDPVLGAHIDALEPSLRGKPRERTTGRGTQALEPNAEGRGEGDLRTPQPGLVDLEDAALATRESTP